jgi:hypothetical protein
MDHRPSSACQRVWARNASGGTRGVHGQLVRAMQDPVDVTPRCCADTGALAAA